MKGTLLLLLSVVFLLLFFACMGRRYGAGKRLGGKAYHMLLLLLLKADLLLAHVIEYVHLALEHSFRGYHYSSAKAQRVRFKEKRLNDCRQQYREDAEGYRRKEKYNRKILE